MTKTLFTLKRLVPLIALLVLPVAPATTQVLSKKPWPTPRMATAGAVVDGRIYVIGGVSNQGRVVATVEEYDPAKDAWTTRASMPTARGGLAAVAVGAKIYALGGRSDRVLSVVEVYDVKNDRWAPVSPLPQARWNLMAADAAGKVLALGGITGTGAARQSVSSVDVFDPAKNAWSAGKQLPVALQSAAVANHDGRIFVAGGRAGAGDTGHATDGVYVYRAETGTWTSGPSLIEARTGAAATVVGSTLVFVGGAAAGRPSPSVDLLDLATQKWNRAGFALSAPRTGHIAATVGGKVYVIGGAIEESLSGITGLVEEITVK
jgi:hypothetical protein